MAPKTKAGSGRTILLIDDDPMLGELVTECLVREGHTVTWATSGEEALRLAATLPAMDLLISDIVMPGLDPREVAARLREGRPDLKVVFVSGQTEGLSLEPGDSFLPKPFTPADIRRTVDQALGRPRHGGTGLVKPQGSHRSRR